MAANCSCECLRPLSSRETNRSAVEVLRHAQHNGLVRRHALGLVRPFARNLYGRLDSLGASVHGQDHVEAEELGDKLSEAREDVVVKRARAQRQPRRLLRESLDQLRVAVALVDGAVGRQEVQVVLALRVPYRSARGSGEDDGQRVVVVGGKFMLLVDGLVRRSGVVLGDTRRSLARRLQTSAAGQRGNGLYCGCRGRHRGDIWGAGVAVMDKTARRYKCGGGRGCCER